MGQELELRWQEYYELVTMVLQWIRHHIVVFEESKFPTSYEEIEVSYQLNKTPTCSRHTQLHADALIALCYYRIIS